MQKRNWCERVLSLISTVDKTALSIVYLYISPMGELQMSQRVHFHSHAYHKLWFLQSIQKKLSKVELLPSTLSTKQLRQAMKIVKDVFLF